MNSWAKMQVESTLSMSLHSRSRRSVHRQISKLRTTANRRLQALPSASSCASTFFSYGRLSMGPRSRWQPPTQAAFKAACSPRSYLGTFPSCAVSRVMVWSRGKSWAALITTALWSALLQCPFTSLVWRSSSLALADYLFVASFPSPGVLVISNQPHHCLLNVDDGSFLSSQSMSASSRSEGR